MTPTVPSPLVLRRVSFVEGLAAGTAFGLFEWLAAGVTRAPWPMPVIVIGAGILGGAVAGMIAALVHYRGAAYGLVSGVAVALLGVSLVSKEVGGSPLLRGGLAGTTLLLALCTAFLVTASCARGRRGTHSWALLVLASVPAGSLLWFALPPHPWTPVAAAALPCFVAVAWFLGRRRVGPIPIVVVLAAGALMLPGWLVDSVPAPPSLPPSSAVAPADAPCIVLVVVDTLRADESDSTPETESAFGRVEREGVRFEQAISSASWTLPSVSSILTSRHPSQHGATTRMRPLPDRTHTLAERLREAGYQTAAFTGGAFVSRAYNLDQGFETFDGNAEYHFRPYRVHVPLAWRFAKNRYFPLRPLLRWFQEFAGVELLRERAEDWLEARDRSRPFFLFVHTYQVHDYYLYHAGSDDPLYTPERKPASIGNRLSTHPDKLPLASAEEVAWFREIYASRFSRVDRELDLLLDAAERAAAPNGLVTVLTADHGEGFDHARHRVHHGSRLHDDLVHVPLLLSAPGRLEPAPPVAEQVRGIDVLPTILDLAGLDVPAGLAGTSLLPPLRGEGEWPLTAWSEQHAGHRLLALRGLRWKIMTTLHGEQRFRLDDDPFEEHPTDEAPPEELTALRAWARELLETEPALDEDVDEAALHRLKAIGY